MLLSSCSSVSNSDTATEDPTRSARIILMITGVKVEVEKDVLGLPEVWRGGRLLLRGLGEL